MKSHSEINVNTPRQACQITLGDIVTGMSTGKRIQEARKRLGEREGRKVTQAELGERCGWGEGAQGRIGNYESGRRELGPQEARALAAALRVSPEWLLWGEAGTGGDLRPVSSAKRVPVISYIQAGNPREVVDAYEPGAGHGEIWVDTTIAGDLGPHTFALEIQGDSMAPEFVPGDVVVIDPDACVRAGDDVVAKLNGGKEATLKRFRDRGLDDQGYPAFELVPANPDYATIRCNSDNPATIIGPVVEHRRHRRRRRHHRG